MIKKKFNANILKRFYFWEKCKSFLLTTKFIRKNNDLEENSMRHFGWLVVSTETKCLISQKIETTKKLHLKNADSFSSFLVKINFLNIKSNKDK